MFSSRSEYDRGVNTFSPEGWLLQVEYAIEAIKLGTTSIGVRCNEGVVLAVERRISSPLLEPASIEKIMEVDSHIGCAMSGLTSDGRTLVEHARSECQNHWFTFDEKLRVDALSQSICDLALRFGEGGDEDEEDEDESQVMSRPFGVALLVAGVDKDGAHLIHCDPSGTYVRFLAKAIGAASEGAQATLEKKYKKDMSFHEAELLALETLKEVMEEKISSVNVEVACVKTDTGKFSKYTKEQVKVLLNEIGTTTLLAEARGQVPARPPQ